MSSMHRSSQYFEQDALFDMFMDQSNDYIFILDQHFHILWCNQTLYRYFAGAQKNVELPCALSTLTSDVLSFREECLNTIELIINNRLIKKQKLINNVTSHRAYHIEWSCVCVHKELFYYALVGRDVSREQQAKQELEQVHEYYENILAQMPELIYWKDTQANYLGCNNNAARVLGLTSRNEIVGLNDKDFPWNADRLCVLREHDLTVLENRKAIIMTEYHELPNKKTMVLSTHKSPLIDKNGNVVGILGISIDITEKIKYEKALQAAKEKAEVTTETQSGFYENILAQMPEYICWKDTKANYLGCNDNVARVFGLNSGKDIIGMNDRDLPWNEERIRVLQEHDLAVLESRKEIAITEYHELPDKTIMVLSTHKSPLIDKNGNVVGILGISIDVTEKIEKEKALEEAKQKAEVANEAKSVFVANMSHDMRTPLTGMLLSIEGLLSHLNNPIERIHCESFRDSTQELLDFLNGVIELMKSEVMGSAIRYQKVDVRRLLDRVVSMVLPVALSKKLKLFGECDANVPQYILSNELVLYRIILNLMSNALKFTQVGEVVVKLSYHSKNQEENADGVLCIEVKDTGIGIPEDKQDIIFDRFTRLTPSYKGIYQGVGLGLYMTKEFIDKLHGEISVTSQVDKGSCFTCAIPAKMSLLNEFLASSMKSFKKEYTAVHKQNDAKQKPEPQPEPKKMPAPIVVTPKAKPRKFKALVVEDSVIVQRGLKVLLESLDIEMVLAPTGEEAVNFFQFEEYDLIFMDIGLPGIDGIEATRLIRECEEGLERERRTPIIAQTAHAGANARSRCLAAGMDAVLEKPLTPIAIKAALEKYVEQKEVRQDLSLLNQTSYPVYPDKIIDLETSVLIVGSEERARTYIKDFAGMLLEYKASIPQACEREDWQAIAFDAHRLYGELSYIALPRLRFAVKEMKDAAEAKDEQSMLAVCDNFNYECDCFLEEFKQVFGK
jgi:two-component system, OmpR family, aerobic respiration control sensor histidine kinase ArcB